MSDFKIIKIDENRPIKHIKLLGSEEIVESSPDSINHTANIELEFKGKRFNISVFGSSDIDTTIDFLNSIVRGQNEGNN